MPRAKQRAIRQFSDEEQKLIDAAMRIESIKSEPQWVARAAVMWARQVIAQDAGLLKRIELAAEPESEFNL